MEWPRSLRRDPFVISKKGEQREKPIRRVGRTRNSTCVYC
jgi:hypothetical protein